MSDIPQTFIIKPQYSDWEITLNLIPKKKDDPNTALHYKGSYKDICVWATFDNDKWQVFLNRNGYGANSYHRATVQEAYESAFDNAVKIAARMREQSVKASEQNLNWQVEWYFVSIK